MSRPIHLIAHDICKEWKKVSIPARPYLKAMFSLVSIHDYFGYDTGKEIVLRFLCNASSFRGEKAEALKQELKDLFNFHIPN